MLKFAPCLEMMFTQYDFYDRFKAAKDSGADAVDFWGWAGKDTDKIAKLCSDLKLTVASACVDTKDETAGKIFGTKKLLHIDESAHKAFYDATEESIAVAKKLGIPSLIVTVGNERNDTTRYEQHTAIVLALKYVKDLLEESGITMIIEPLNILCNHMGYFLASSYEAFSVCQEVGSDRVKVLYDIYHQQITEGNLIPTIRKYFDYIGHFHVADVPGRHEPGTGEINYKNVFAEIEKLGYDKYVGLEYSPTKDSAETVKSVMDLCR